MGIPIAVIAVVVIGGFIAVAAAIGVIGGATGTVAALGGGGGGQTAVNQVAMQETCAGTGSVNPVERGTTTETVADVTLNPDQIVNVKTIIGVGKARGVPEKGIKVAIGVAMLESTMRNLGNDGSWVQNAKPYRGKRAWSETKIMTKNEWDTYVNPTIKASMTLPHEGQGSNWDSIGLFQQRPIAGWAGVNIKSGADAQQTAASRLLNPAFTALAFYGGADIPWNNPPGLMDLWASKGFDNMPFTKIAQTVQQSDAPDSYAKWEPFANAAYAKYASTTPPVGVPSGVQLNAGGAGGPATTAPTTGADPSGATPGPTESISPTTSDAADREIFLDQDPANMPYPLPARKGKTGAEEPVDTAGRVPSTGGKVTWSHFAALGQPYRDYYITMRWNYAAWNFDGTATGIDQAQYAWFSRGNNGKPWLVLVTNPRTNKSIIAAAIEAGPGPWVGVQRGSSREDRSGVWRNPQRGTPANYTGIVSGFPPAAIKALDATTGYLGQQGDELIYQWAPDQNATPGTTGLVASDSGEVAGVQQGCNPAIGLGGTVNVNGPDVTIPNHPDVPEALRGKTVKAPTAEVAAGLAAGFSALGLPYVWGGGGGADGAPNDGCQRGGGQSTSCKGLIGYDCSGLTSMVMLKSGVPGVPAQSGAQRSGGVSVPFAQAVPGDIIGWSGHVAIYLGNIGGDGTLYMLEAPTSGLNVRISKIRDGHDSEVHRWWKAPASVPAG